MQKATFEGKTYIVPDEQVIYEEEQFSLPSPIIPTPQESR